MQEQVRCPGVISICRSSYKLTERHDVLQLKTTHHEKFRCPGVIPPCRSRKSVLVEYLNTGEATVYSSGKAPGVLAYCTASMQEKVRCPGGIP
jgi:hypothetical protein